MIVRSSIWGSQPQVPVEIDFGNPLANGLVIAINAGASGGKSRLQNAARPANSVQSDTTNPVISGTGKFGKHVQNDGYFDGSYDFADASGVSVTTSSEFVLLNGIVSPIGVQSIFAAQVSNDYIGLNSSRQPVVVTGGSARVTGTAVSATVPVALGYTSGDNNYRTYQDGALTASTLSSSANGAIARPVWFLNCDGGTSEKVRIALYLRWENRTLSAADFRRLYENPWQIFKPMKRRIYADTFGAGGGSFNPVWALNSTVTIGAAA